MKPSLGAIAPQECLDRESLLREQGRRLDQLFTAIQGCNRFYARKFDEAGIAAESLSFPTDLPRLPFTTKSELVAAQAENPPWGASLNEPIARYSRYCQTSGTTGAPLRWLDTAASWQWMLESWKTLYRAVYVNGADRIFFPFSFGPFLGFWTAFEAACQIGALAVPGGGMSSQLRLKTIETIGATVICCTPTYALWLAEVAGDDSTIRPLGENAVRALIVAGEPGGSIVETRQRIERSWGARVIDHYGLTETGPIAFECWESPGALHVNECEYIGEVLDPATGKSVPDGQSGEFVVTNLGRTSSPVIRYRTGDIVVRRSDPCVCGRTWARLEGGILARTDDMIAIRGVNVYPTAIESVVRSFPQIVEFRSTASHNRAMWTLTMEIEPSPGATDLPALASKVSQKLREALGLTVPVRVVEPGSLPRFEMKARRFVVEK